MDQLGNLFPMSGIPSAIYYGCIILVTVFLSGWFLNSRLNKLCKDTQQDLEDEMIKLKNKVTALENDKIHKTTYEEGMRNVCELIGEVRREMKENFNSLSGRIDTLLLAQSK